ncbi:MAG TPA: hypothetical protein VN660_02115 [Steroidobacteraceae bacterium]|nr:hypothetical protein [Steroidobacteraceae bacterium]
MAKSKSTRHRAPKRKSGRKAAIHRPREVEICERHYELVNGCIEIDGHRLDAQRIEQFRGLVEDRYRIATRPRMAAGVPSIGDPVEYAHRVGLSDLLWRHRPDVKAKERLSELGSELQKRAMSISAMDGFYFTDAPARGPGAEALGKLIEEAETELTRLRHFACSIGTQGAGYLQNWIAREEEFQRIGTQEVGNG